VFLANKSTLEIVNRTGLPDDIHYSFFLNLTILLREDHPSSFLTNLVVTSVNKKIFLLETSILGRTVEHLSALAHEKLKE
jgi:hypothetical protein